VYTSGAAGGVAGGAAGGWTDDGTVHDFVKNQL